MTDQAKKEASSPIPDSRITEIRARAEQATPGPWEMHTDRNYYDGPLVDVIPAGGGDGLLGGPGHYGFGIGDESPQSIADGAFIAHAREDVPYLLSALEASEARLKAAEQEIRDWRVAEAEIGNAYLRIRQLVGAWDTNHGGENRFDVTEGRVLDLLAKSGQLEAENASLRAQLDARQTQTDGEGQ